MSPLAVVMAAAGVALALVATRWRSPGGWTASSEVSGPSSGVLTGYRQRDGAWAQVMDVLAELGLPLGIGLLLAGGALLAVPLVSLGGRLAARVHAVGRLAIRDSARQRTRSAATVAATMIVLVVPVIVLTMVSTSDEAQRQHNEVLRNDVAVVHGPGYAQGPLPPTDDMVAQARELVAGTVSEVRMTSLPGLELHLATPGSPDDDRRPPPPPTMPAQLGDAALATPELLELVGVDPQTDAVVVARPPGFRGADETLPASGRVALRPTHPTAGEGADGVPVDVVDAPRSLGWNVPNVLVPAAVAEQLDVEPRAEAVVLERDTPFTGAERRDLMEAQQAQDLVFRVEPPAVEPDSALGRVFAFAVGGALLLALVIAALTAALAATESDRDLRVMAAIGADPKVRPRFRAVQAGYHTLLAGLVALPVGLLLSGLARQGEGTTLGLTVPWGWLLAMVPLVVVPIALVFRLCSRSSPVHSAVRRPT